MFPNESREYRTLRDQLLGKESELRSLTEEVASLRRSLPPGGKVEKAYEFYETNGAKTKLSSLFESSKTSLFIYHFMFSSSMVKPCSMCASLLDGIHAQVRQLTEKINVAILADRDPESLGAWQSERPWPFFKMLSSQGSDFIKDYRCESESGQALPVFHVFSKRDQEIYHMWGSELMFEKTPGDPRHADLFWPLWGILDLCPEGRGDHWYPSL